MKQFLLAAATLVMMASNASADDYTAADIAKLPQDKVAVIKQHCARIFSDNFEMREYCENQQYEALQRLINRGSVKLNGERL